MRQRMNFALGCVLHLAFYLLPFYFLLFPAASLPAGEASLPNVRFVQSGRTASSWPLFVAEEKRLFQKNGIYVEEIIIRGGTNVTRAVLSNTIPIGRINPDYVIDAIEKGAKVKIVSGALDKLPYDLIARPDRSAIHPVVNCHRDTSRSRPVPPVRAPRRRALRRVARTITSPVPGPPRAGSPPAGDR